MWYCVRHVVSDPPSARVGRLVCQSMGVHRSLHGGSAPAPPVSTDLNGPQASQRSLCKLQQRGPHMSERNVNPVPRAEAASNDLQAWPEALTHWLIRHAACRAPPDLSERLEEEWRGGCRAP